MPGWAWEQWRRRRVFVRFSILYFYFLSVYLCQWEFSWLSTVSGPMGLRADVGAMTRPDKGWHSRRKNMIFGKHFNHISLFLSIVFLPFDQVYFSLLIKCVSLGPDCGADESYRLEGRIGTLHSCLGHPLQQLNMMETNTKIDNYKYKYKQIQIQEGRG